MDAINPKNLSPLVQAVLALDRDFQDLERLRENIEHSDLETESGLDRTRNLLKRFGESGTRLADNLQGFAKILGETRDQAEKSATVVAQRTQAFQARVESTEQIFIRFQGLVEKVRTLAAHAADVDQASLSERCSDLNIQLGALIAEVQEFKDDARAANLKSVEKNAEALAQSMSASLRKLQNYSAPTGAEAN